MRRLDLLLSFDHELSLGGTRDVDHNLFAPTARLLDEADALGVRITLFTDVHCGLRYREWDPDGFHARYVEQLRDAVQRGHDVQLHIHPHWADSVHDGTTFRPSRNFALADFAGRAPDDALSIESLVRRGVEYLTDLCRAADPDYVCVAYRAGGFNLAPETARILRALWDAGIRVDSSIPKGFVFRSGLSSVDYRDTPVAANWRLASTGSLQAVATEGIYEVPVATRPRTPLNNLPFLIKRVLLRRRAHDPRGLPIHSGRTSRSDLLRRMFPRSAWLLGFDVHTDSVADQMRILRHHLRRHRGAEQVAVSTVSHPKNMGATSFALMRGFVRAVRQAHGDVVHFPTFRELNERVNESVTTAREAAETCRVS